MSIIDPNTLLVFCSNWRSKVSAEEFISYFPEKTNLLKTVTINWFTVTRFSVLRKSYYNPVWIWSIIQYIHAGVFLLHSHSIHRFIETLQDMFKFVLSCKCWVFKKVRRIEILHCIARNFDILSNHSHSLRLKAEFS